jgi:adenosyl cobinamide kinase/adenosyl cobinamide phosphate guanylyltransferase
VIVLVLGGTRSGKSEVAERLAARLAAAAGIGRVAYLATAAAPSDAEHAERIDRHRRRRPDHWTTREVGAALVPALETELGPVLVDSLGTWVASHPDLVVDPTALLAVLANRATLGAPTVLVSEEVGLSVHPPSELGRVFVDVLGELNRAVAEVADRVLLVVAGRVLELPADGPADLPAVLHDEAPDRRPDGSGTAVEPPRPSC